MDGYKVHGTEAVWASACPSSRLTALFVVHSGKYIKMILIIKVFFALLYFNTFSKQLRETEQGFLSESAGVNMIRKWTLTGHYLCEPMSSPRGRVVLALIAMMNYLKKVFIQIKGLFWLTVLESVGMISMAPLLWAFGKQKCSAHGCKARNMNSKSGVHDPPRAHYQASREFMLSYTSYKFNHVLTES